MQGGSKPPGWESRINLDCNGELYNLMYLLLRKRTQAVALSSQYLVCSFDRSRRRDCTGRNKSIQDLTVRVLRCPEVGVVLDAARGFLCSTTNAT